MFVRLYRCTLCCVVNNRIVKILTGILSSKQLKHSHLTCHIHRDATFPILIGNPIFLLFSQFVFTLRVET